MIVADSSPVIILAKQGLLELFKKFFHKLVIPQSVYEEVMQKRETPEAIALTKAIEDKWLFVERVTVNPILKTEKIGEGEKEAISLALKHKSILIIDDDSAKKYASILGVEAHGTLYIVYLACIKNFIRRNDALNVLKGIMADGFYISAEVYNRYYELLSSIKGK